MQFLASYNWLQSYFDKKLPEPEKLAELINTHVFEIESVKKLADDSVFDIKVMPDRAHYALCHKGIAREIRAIMGIPLKEISNLPERPESSGRAGEQLAISHEVRPPDVKIGESHLCRRYMAKRIENVVVSASPEHIVKLLEAAGARAINTIVDATNFVMFDVGQPLHAFDADKVKGAIHVRLAGEGEKITLLDGKEVILGLADLLIADDEGPLAIAGVKGGKRAEVTNETKNIIIESANFDPVSVRRTSTRLNLRNESSKRFENEIVPELAEEAMEKVVSAILGFSPEAKVGEVTDVFLNKTELASIRTSASEIENMIGMKISDSDLERIFSALGVSFTSEGGAYVLTPMLDRLDLKIPADIADEVSRLYGYGRLPSVIPPKLSKHASLDKLFFFAEKTKNILKDLGFSETLLYTLVPKGAFEIAYPLASDKSALRESIVPKMKESLRSNLLNAELLGLSTIKVFEIGKVFPKNGEKTVLSMGVAFQKKKKSVSAESVLKEAVKKLEDELGAPGRETVEIGEYGAVVEIDFDARIENLSVPKDLGKLGFEALGKDKIYKPFSLYPYITRDVAFFAPSGTLVKEAHAVIVEAVSKSGRELLVKGPDLFDEFSKDGKTSFAFRMIFQSFERTLSDDEVNKVMEKVYEAVKGEGWIPR